MDTLTAIFAVLLAALVVFAVGAIVSALLGHVVITIGRAIVED